MNLNKSYKIDVESAYIITLKGNETSQSLSKRCQESCDSVEMPYKVWDAFDGTSGEIKTPEHLKEKDYLNWVKWVDQELSPSEVACALSHFSLWCHCLNIDKPIVILEHDAIMVEKFDVHLVYNSIMYLGCVEQVEKGWGVYPTPPHATNGNNYHFICRAHAYSIDPTVAKNLVSHVIKYGIHESLDIMLRADIFPIVQMGVYAYDKMGETTITDRKKTFDGKER